MTDTSAPAQVPLVDYLVLGDQPHLVANQCTGCGARFFDRRNACAGCFGTEFTKVAIGTEGEVRSFTIVTFAAPGVPVPFVAAVVDCGSAPTTTAPRPSASASNPPDPRPTSHESRTHEHRR
jgi:uncharacterized OB-fold protein